MLKSVMPEKDSIKFGNFSEPFDDQLCYGLKVAIENGDGISCG